MAISAEFADPLARWHPRCFTCTECDELLDDLLYYNIADKVYCRKHYLNEHKPKVFCAACDMVKKFISLQFNFNFNFLFYNQPIQSNEYVKAEKHFWHKEQ